MKVKDLIRELQQFDPNLELFVDDGDRIREVTSVEKRFCVSNIIGTQEDLQKFKENVERELRKELESRGYSVSTINKIVKERVNIDLSNKRDVVVIDIL